MPIESSFSSEKSYSPSKFTCPQETTERVASDWSRAFFCLEVSHLGDLLSQVEVVPANDPGTLL